MKGHWISRWVDLPPFALLGMGGAIYEMVAHGYHVAWLAVVLWCVSYTLERLMHKAAQRDVAWWKDEAIMVRSAAILLAYAAAGGDPTATSPPDRAALDEAGRRVSNMVVAVRRAEAKA